MKAGAATLAFVISATACHRGGNGTQEADTAATYQSDDSYHADNDILMTVGSMIDAMRVGERLDTAYAFRETVLTDGTGRPLYAGLDGYPGRWNMSVESDTSVVLANTGIGDLGVEDLKAYLLPGTAVEGVTDYDLGDGIEMRFNTRVDTTAAGLTGPMLRITLLRHTHDSWGRM